MSFAGTSVPLLTPQDIDCIPPLGVHLNDYSYMSNRANARNVLEQVPSGRTPERDSGEPRWDQAKVQLVRDWINTGFPP